MEINKRTFNKLTVVVRLYIILINEKHTNGNDLQRKRFKTWNETEVKTLGTTRLIVKKSLKWKEIFNGIPCRT